jgi:hypothetical protein
MIRDDQQGRAFELVVLPEPVRAAVRMKDRYAFVVAQHLLPVDTGSDPEGRRILALAVNVAEVHTRDGGVSAAVVPYARGIAAEKGIVSGVRSLRLPSGLLVGELDTFAAPSNVLTGGKVSRSFSRMSWLRSGAAAAARRRSSSSQAPASLSVMPPIGSSGTTKWELGGCAVVEGECEESAVG